MNTTMKNATPNMPAPEKKNISVPTGLPPVILCDDHAVLRTGLAHILERAGIDVVAACGAVPELLERIACRHDAIVVVDLGIEQLPFPELVKLLRETSPHCRIVVYSMREAAGTIELCYDAGAIAFVPKSDDPEEIVRAVRCAADGKRYLPSSVAATLAGFHLADRQSPPGTLTVQERDVFVGYARGMTVDILAKKMRVSTKRIQNVLSMISKKLDAPRSTFFQMARRYGMVDWE